MVTALVRLTGLTFDLLRINMISVKSVISELNGNEMQK